MFNGTDIGISNGTEIGMFNGNDIDIDMLRSKYLKSASPIN